MTSFADQILKTFIDHSVFRSFAEISESPDDPETIEECRCFLDKKWVDLSIDDWRYHYYAISFFNLRAKLVFLPSIMFLSIDNLEYIRLAVESYLWEFKNGPMLHELPDKCIVLTKEWISQFSS